MYVWTRAQRLTFGTRGHPFEQLYNVLVAQNRVLAVGTKISTGVPYQFVVKTYYTEPGTSSWEDYNEVAVTHNDTSDFPGFWHVRDNGKLQTGIRGQNNWLVEDNANLGASFTVRQHINGNAPKQFTRLANGHILAYSTNTWGGIEPPAPSNAIVRSSDAGQTYSSVQMIGLTESVNQFIECGQNIVLAVGIGDQEVATNRNKVWLSTNGGYLFQEQNIPGEQYASAWCGFATGTGVVVLLGWNAAGNKPTMWRSTDYGGTFGQPTYPFPGLGTAALPRFYNVLKNGSTIIATLTGYPGYDANFKPFAVSTDEGQTWQLETSLSSTLDPYLMIPRGIAVAPNGRIVCGFQQYLTGTPHAEIWEGQIVNPPESQSLAAPPYCHHPFFQAECNQEC